MKRNATLSIASSTLDRSPFADSLVSRAAAPDVHSMDIIEEILGVISAGRPRREMGPAKAGPIWAHYSQVVFGALLALLKNPSAAKALTDRTTRNHFFWAADLAFRRDVLENKKCAEIGPSLKSRVWAHPLSRAVFHDQALTNMETGDIAAVFLAVFEAHNDVTDDFGIDVQKNCPAAIIEYARRVAKPIRAHKD